MSAQERPSAVTLRNEALTLVGPALRAGDRAPGFQVHGPQFEPVSLADFRGKIKVFVSVHSVQTPICDAEIRRFELEASQLAGVEFAAFSMDLPFGLERFCGLSGVERVRVLSDYFAQSFSQGWGVFIKENRLSSRAVFIVDGDDRILYAEYVPEVAQHPNYAAALAFLRQALKARPILQASEAIK